MLPVEVSEDNSDGKQVGQPKYTGYIKKRYCYFCKCPSHYITECPKIAYSVSEVTTVLCSERTKSAPLLSVRESLVTFH